jgi:hypothetical protein
MEPSGRNQWQPVANAGRQKPRKQAKTVAVGCDRLRATFQGKEGGRRFESVRGLCTCDGYGAVYGAFRLAAAGRGRDPAQPLPAP